MTYKPVPTKKFKKFLRKKGLRHQRTHGDHEIWDYPGNSPLLRPVTFIGCEKEIPALHIQTNLKTMDMDYAEFVKEISKL
ncbi:MAG: hypothetical protein JXJ22_16045 [Bacteroidales bacterium]|nr:hypothetical protein [Bacteroidales bacterium]